jgi:hypothetical protein
MTKWLRPHRSIKFFSIFFCFGSFENNNILGESKKQISWDSDDAEQQKEVCRSCGDRRSLLENLDLFFIFSHAEKFLQNDSPANKN